MFLTCINNSCEIIKNVTDYVLKERLSLSPLASNVIQASLKYGLVYEAVMDGYAYNVRIAFRNKRKESNKFQMDELKLDVLLELVVIRDRMFSIHCLSKDDCL